MTRRVEIDTKEGARLRITLKGERVELRALSRLSASSNVFAPTKDSVSVPLSAAAAVAEVLTTLAVQS